jgi:hypothetical protein
MDNGFTEWVLFRCRTGVPSKPGIYLLAQFDDGPAATVDPLTPDPAVIDIGMSASASVGIKSRLDGFEEVAHTGRGKSKAGKSSGWTYRTAFVKSYEQLINFGGLYVSWIEIPNGNDELIEKMEDGYISIFKLTHGRSPAICRQRQRKNFRT